MARTLTAGFISEIEADQLSPILMTVAAFDSGTIRTWTGYGDLVYGGDTFSGIGDLLSIESVEETQELTPTNVRFILNGIPTATLSLALTENYQGRRIEAYFGVMNASNALIADPYMIFAGRMDTIEITDSGETCTISVNAESDLIDLRTNRERKYTAEDQKATYPSDKFFDFVSQIQDIQLPWGVKA